MAYSINTNIASLQAQEYLRLTSDFQQKTINRVTSGLRIISSGDDAAGLAIANSFRSDLAVLTQGIRNANDGLSTLQTIDGGINNISKLLDRARTLATQSASGTFTGSRTVLNTEFQSVIDEIDRQAQAIGLNQNGSFARSLAVFIGGGRASGNITDISNGSVAVDLTTSTVDAQSLGLKGVQATNGTAYDLGASSTTSVANIVANANNVASASDGYTDFYFYGPEFSDADRIKVTISHSDLGSTETLVSRLNDAIAAAGNGGTAAATAFKNANIKASVVTDSDGKQKLAFTSSVAAFQVKAGDLMSNALLGNFNGGGPEGAAITNTVAGAGNVATGTNTFTQNGNVIFRIQGGGLEGVVDLTVATVAATTTVTTALASLSSQVANNAQLQAAGITLTTAASGSPLLFTNAHGDRFEVMVAGDVDNYFGMGGFRLDTATATSFDYTTITGASGQFQGGSQVLEFSLAGGAKRTITVDMSSAEAGIATATQVLNNLFAADAEMVKAGIVASNDGTNITIASSNGTAFRMNVVDAQAVVTGTAYGSFNITTGTSDALTFAVNGGGDVVVVLAQNQTANAANIATQLNGNANFNGANLTATVVNGRIRIATNHGTAADSSIEVKAVANNAYTALGLTAGNTYTDNLLGFDSSTTVGTAYTANTTTNNTTTAPTINSGGAYQTEALDFAAIRYGTDDQTITIAVNNATGTPQTMQVVLRNDATARNGRTVDQAVATINTAIQATNNDTLQKIVAVKELSGGSEKIRFISTLQDFKVTLGATQNTVGVGSSLQQGKVNSSTQSSGGSTADISTQSMAQDAVTALATAVSALGVAQAVVGKGQNQFNYAVNLAQTQLSNIAAAESRIRDADLAAEAANLTKAQILQQAGIAALAQANVAPQAVLTLLRG